MEKFKLVASLISLLVWSVLAYINFTNPNQSETINKFFLLFCGVFIGMAIAQLSTYMVKRKRNVYDGV